MYIDTTEPSENVGQIHFCIEYDFQNSTLILKILQVKLIDFNLNLFKLEQYIFILNNEPNSYRHIDMLSRF